MALEVMKLIFALPYKRQENIRGTHLSDTFLINKFSASTKCRLPTVCNITNLQSLIIHYRFVKSVYIFCIYRGFRVPERVHIIARNSQTMKFSMPLCDCKIRRGGVPQSLHYIT